MNITSRYLNYSTCCSALPLTCSIHALGFWRDTPIFLVVIFIPAWSHAAENHSCWKPYCEDATSTQASAKSRRMILKLLTVILSSTPLAPSIHSGKPEEERRPTWICPGSPSLQHLYLWPAKHCLQKVCICCRSRDLASWWSLAGSGRDADQEHGNCRWISADLEGKAQHYKNGVQPSISTTRS